MILFVLLPLLSTCSRHDHRPSIILIIIDTLRADHLGCYGYDLRDTSPSIDSLASAGRLWEQCRSQAPWTLPATTSILSGLTERSHGTTMQGGHPSRVHPELPYLPQVMQDAGYNTMGVFNVFLLGTDFGFERGFDTFSCHSDGNGRARSSVEELLSWLHEDASSNPETPFFAVLHLYDPHMPYAPPPPFDTRFLPEGDTCTVYSWFGFCAQGVSADTLDHLVALYDGEIAWVDSQLSRLFSFVRKTGIAERTVIILTADHGEEFLEHNGIGHGHTFYEELIHVPLVVSGPGFESGGRDHSPVCQIDIAPTIYSLAGVEIPEIVEGTSLLEGSICPARPQPSSGVNLTRSEGSVVPLAAVTSGAIKSILVDSGDGLETIAYDLAADPQELDEMAADSASITLLIELWSRPRLFSPALVDLSEVRPQLRDLGYI
jgi:arylsulfatase A-like enzyme